MVPAPEKEEPGFKSILDKWKNADKKITTEHTPFIARKPARKKSVMMVKNQKAINDYRKNLMKRQSTRRGLGGKPTKLNEVVGVKLGNLSDYNPPVFEKTAAEIEIIKETVKKNFFFEGMSPTELNTFIMAFEPLEMSKGQTVISQGEKGDYFYIILEGVVSFEVNDEYVGMAGAGKSFGELALLYTCPRAATVYAASEPTILFRVDQKTFRSLLQKQTKKSEDTKLEILKGVDFLKDIDKADLKRLSRALIPRHFKEDDVLCRKGDEGDTFYVIHEGEMIVTDISVGTTKFDDVTLKPGDYFGERAVATSEPRAATVTALTNGVAFSIDRATFEKVLGKFSRLVIKAQDRRLLEGMKLFKEARLKPKHMEQLAQLVTDQTFQAGKVIFRTLKKTDAALYIVHEGSVQLSGARDELITAGDYFGDDQLLLDTKNVGTPNQATPTFTAPYYTATAVGDCACGVLSLYDCRNVFDTTTLVDEEGLDALFSPDEKTVVDLNASVNFDGRPELERDNTQKWLARTSREGLRDSVKQDIGLDDFERHSVLGEGQFGEVWLVTADLPEQLGGRHHFALKIQMKDDPTRGNSVDAVKREIDVLSIMDHPYIVNLVHHYEDTDNLYILMGLVHGGELFDVIHQEGDDGVWASGIPEDHAKFYAMVVADTLDYMHRKHFVFRDLKPENILIDKDGYPIICDFGFAKYVTDKTYTLCGTPNYLAPEVILNTGHNASCDHWGLGVVIYEMVCGGNPFYYDGMEQMALFQAICQDKFYALPDDVSDEAHDVMADLLEKDPTRRLGAFAGRGKDIMKMKWFDGLDYKLLRQKQVKAPFLPSNLSLDTLIEQSSVDTFG